MAWVNVSQQLQVTTAQAAEQRQVLASVQRKRFFTRAEPVDWVCEEPHLRSPRIRAMPLRAPGTPGRFARAVAVCASCGYGVETGATTRHRASEVFDPGRGGLEGDERAGDLFERIDHPKQREIGAKVAGRRTRPEQRPDVTRARLDFTRARLDFTGARFDLTDAGARLTSLRPVPGLTSPN